MRGPAASSPWPMTQAWKSMRWAAARYFRSICRAGQNGWSACKPRSKSCGTSPAIGGQPVPCGDRRRRRTPRQAEAPSRGDRARAAGKRLRLRSVFLTQPRADGGAVADDEHAVSHRGAARRLIVLERWLPKGREGGA
jgi:hypothetical protein